MRKFIFPILVVVVAALIFVVTLKIRMIAA